MKPEDVTGLHSSLETIIYYLRNSEDYDAEYSIGKVCDLLPKTLSVHKDLPVLANRWNLCVKHAISFYEFVEVFAFKHIKELIPLEFKKDWSSVISFEVDNYLRNRMKKLSNENLCMAMRRFVMRYLVGDFNDKQPLGPYLRWKLDIWSEKVDEEMLEEFDQSFPKSVLVSHSWVLLERLGGLEERKKPQSVMKAEMVVMGAKTKSQETKKVNWNQRNNKNNKW